MSEGPGAIAALLPRLAAFYGPLPVPPADPFGAFLWEVLGTKTTAGRRDAALMALRRVPALTPDAVRKLGRGRLEAIARTCGPFAEARVSAIETGVEVFRRRPHLTNALQGPLRDAWLAARDLPHVGEAGALRVLLFSTAHGVIPADQDLTRWAVRMGLAPRFDNLRRTVRGVRRSLASILPSDLHARRHAVLLLSHHAQSTCVDFDPHCRVCPIATVCEEGKVRGSAW
ncbi:MAG TPA: hypothetical protein VF136_13625 [Methylomirabilota bacterium]